nr:unnamed protein product [Digitaria exilis]
MPTRFSCSLLLITLLSRLSLPYPLELSPPLTALDRRHRPAMLQLHPPRFLPLPSHRLAGRRRRARPALALNSKWKLPDVDKARYTEPRQRRGAGCLCFMSLISAASCADAVRERVRSWMSLARGAIADAAQSARERARHKEDPESGKKQQRKEVAVEEQALVDVPEVTGWLSLDAVVSIEQFAR